MSENVADESQYVEVNFILMVDEDGDYEIGQDEDEARERFDAEVGSDRARHLIHLSIRVPMPQPIKVSGALPRREDGNYSLQIAQQ
ncbi:MAG: hypothetical protein P8Y36_08225 [Alphaproteobacteria bacterium]